MKDKDATILVVDDTPANLSVLFDTLQGAGFRVLTAESGESALTRVQYAQPDLILLDIMMPGLDGFEICRRLCQIESLAQVPIIFMTALSDTEDKINGFQAGGVDYIVKPFRKEEVLARIRVHLRLRQTQWQLEQELKAKGELIRELEAFAHTVAHDLRTPINGILGFAELLHSNWQTMPESEKLESLQYIIKGSANLAKIIHEILLLSTVRQEECILEPTCMLTVLQDVLERLQLAIKEAEATIALNGPWPKVWGYGPWLAEVWSNYLSNALKYGGRPPQIEIGSEPGAEDGWVRYYVKDRGDGIPEDQQAKLFLPFSRLGRPSDNSSGLGLSIVQRILDKLKGKVGVRSQVGQGSTFYFELPLSP